MDTGSTIYCIDCCLPNSKYSGLVATKSVPIVFPHLMLGDEVARITELEGQFGLAKNSAADVKAAGVPGGLKSIAVAHAGVDAGGMAVWKYISLAICMMVGTASLPHILMRYFTTPSVKSARKSVAWSLFFIFLPLLFSSDACDFVKFH